jgi:hypothetical protein
MYYSLIDKQGSKSLKDEDGSELLEPIDFDDVEDCAACKL